MTALLKILVNLLGTILKLAGYRPMVIGLPDRIGHLVGEVDMPLKEQAINGDTRRPFFVFDRSKLANTAMLDFWKREVTCVEWAGLFTFVHRHAKTLTAWERIDLTGERYGEACSAYDGPHLLSLNEQDRARGKQFLKELGLPEDAWYVCFHIREGGYLPEMNYHSYRDASIGNSLEAMQWVVDQGGYVFRMGDSSMTPIEGIDGIIDYAHLDNKTPFMDVYLCATCRFMLGSSSGLFCISGVFGQPVGCVNMTPMGSIPFYPDNMFTSMLVQEKESKRILSFPEVMKDDIGTFWRLENYEDRGLRTVENDAEDITQLTREMFEMTRSGEIKITLSPLQRQFRSLLRKEHSGYPTKAHIGASFTKRYEHLFNE